jgi:hypothetical protein
MVGHMGCPVLALLYRRHVIESFYIGIEHHDAIILGGDYISLVLAVS